jgi:CelD/BcsL family acetyltransferase involved in cellulose biosynthesis
MGAPMSSGNGHDRLTRERASLRDDGREDRRWGRRGVDVEILCSPGEVVAHAEEWDDLWARSTIARPTARARQVQLWCDHFAPAQPFQAILVRDGRELVAALPLVQARRLPAVAGLPSNDWAACGTLLVGAAADMRATADALLDALPRTRWRLWWLRNVPWQAESWSQLTAAAARRRAACHALALHEVGCVDLNQSWSRIEEQWSGNHRRHMRKALRRAEREGGVELIVRSRFSSEADIDASLRAAFEIEARGWKGRERTAVVQQDRMLDFVIAQAVELARHGYLRLVTLVHRGAPIAFEYCWQARGTVFTPKVGFDERYAQLSPGQLLRYLHFRRLAAETPAPVIDFGGPLADFTRRWTTHHYQTGTVVLGRPGMSGQLLVAGYRARLYWKQRRVAPTPARSE